MNIPKPKAVMLLSNPYIKRELKRPLAWARKRTQSRAMILMYHGVGAAEVDPWSLFVESDVFSEHMAIHKALGTPMPLVELAAAHRAGSVPDRAIAVTFDDGYLNNLTAAEPILSAHGVPATVFAIANPIKDEREFWWDELAALILRPRDLPRELVIAGTSINLVTGSARTYSPAQFEADLQYREGVGDPSDRIALYTQLWEELMPMVDPARKVALDQLAAAVGTERTHRVGYRPVTEAQLIDLDETIIDVGAHTMSHPLLPRFAAEDQQDEIGRSKAYLEEVLNRPVSLFSYPFGGRDRTTINAVKAAGFDSACSTFQETVSTRNSPFELPRFDAKNWPAEEFERRIQQWFRFV